MTLKKKIAIHTGFWLIYFCVILFNELFLSESFLADPSVSWLYKAIASQLLVLSVKIAAVYYVLYRFIPAWLKPNKKAKLVMEGCCVFILLLIFYRVLMHLVIWPYIYGSSVHLSLLSVIARIFYSLLDILQVVGIAAAIKLFRMKIAAVKREKQMVQEKLSSELLHLKAQVNPHFLFNSLNSIFSLARLQSPDTPEMILKLSSILRYMLYESGKKQAALSDELNIVNDYIELQLMRYGKKAEVKKEIVLKNSSAQVTPLLILPLIENAFKHGISGSDKISVIHFQLTGEHYNLRLQIKNAIVKTSMTETSKQGIGLSNIRRQLELLYGKYEFNYYKTDGEFIVNLNIDLNSYAGTELFNN